MAHHSGMSLLAMDNSLYGRADAAAISELTRGFALTYCCCRSEFLSQRSEHRIGIASEKPETSRPSRAGRDRFTVFHTGGFAGARRTSAFQWPLSCSYYIGRKWFKPMGKSVFDAMAGGCVRETIGELFYTSAMSTPANAGPQLPSRRVRNLTSYEATFFQGAVEFQSDAR